MLPSSTMALPSSILATILLFSLPKPAFAQKDNGDECSCFRTNGSSEGYFAYHRFHDFRNVPGASATPPTVLANETNATNALATSDFFLSDDWTNDWTIQNWNNTDDFAESGASILMINSPNNVYIEQSTDNSPDYSSYLTFRTSRLPDFQSAAQIDSNEANYQYLSARFLARVIGSPGACAGIFTYLAPSSNNPNSVQEADIEILTRDPRNRVQYTNQPSTIDGNDVPQATVNGTNPGAEWTQWNVYRMDWMPKSTSWYVNGVSVANISYQVPRDPSMVIINMWGDGGVWTGNMSLYDEAFLQIQWMELVFNTSGPYSGSSRKRDGNGVGGVLEKRKGTPGCKVVCSVDEEVNVTGTPALLYNSTAATRMMPWRGEGVAKLVWIPLVVVGGMVFGYL